MFTKTKLIFSLIPFYLTLALPTLLITGPFLSDLAISICGLLFLINSFRIDLRKYYNNKLVKFLIIFYFVIVISSLTSQYELFSLKSSFFYFRFMVFALSVFYLIDTNKNFLKYFFLSLSFSYFILVFDGYYQYFFHENLIGLIPQKDANGPRISSFFGSELILGSYLSRLFPLYFGLFVYFAKEMNNKYFILHFVFFCLIYILVFITGERTSFFILNLSLIFFIFLINDLKKYFFLIIIILISFFSVTLYFKPEIGNRMIKYTFNQFKPENNKIVIFSEMHTAHYKTAIKMFLDNKILGIGPNNFRKRCAEKKYETLAFDDSGSDITNSCSTHPHNTYLQLIAETGIIGFSLIIFLFISLTILSLKIFFKINGLKLNNFTISLIGSFVVNLFPIMPSGNFFNNYINIIYYLPLGFLLWSLQKS
jgi:O-antigen ligase